MARWVNLPAIIGLFGSAARTARQVATQALHGVDEMSRPMSAQGLRRVWIGPSLALGRGGGRLGSSGSVAPGELGTLPPEGGEVGVEDRGQEAGVLDARGADGLA
jgi:hypothetical protein